MACCCLAHSDGAEGHPWCLSERSNAGGDTSGQVSGMSAPFITEGRIPISHIIYRMISIFLRLSMFKLTWTYQEQLVDMSCSKPAMGWGENDLYNKESILMTFSTSQRSMFHVLHSFSLFCSTCGYCQGMGPLAATLLCYLEPEVCKIHY
jgi:hypothetical protein